MSNTPKPGVIELRLRDLKQLFNSMDPSPFQDKDLDADAEEFIVSWAKEFSWRDELVLLIHLDDYTGDRDPQALAAEAIHAYFAQRAELTRRRFRQLMRRGYISLAVGLLFLTACLAAGDIIKRHGGGGTFPGIIRESLIIGGWVAMWGPMEIFLYDWWPLRGERHVYERLSRMPVKVMLQTSPEPPEEPSEGADEPSDKSREISGEKL